jgi:hypothetical protein
MKRIESYVLHTEIAETLYTPFNDYALNKSAPFRIAEIVKGIVGLDQRPFQFLRGMLTLGPELWLWPH